ncbi:hypothetical protein MKEN_01408400 [Mycena kentingensis (nom. inval.)]|nr:hypothetical protein MKEN_01408400 [Mycena kentingensis (nom. inval.)]
MSTRKIAVVGTGLAGLTAAHLLSAPHSGVQFEVHLFEKAETLGMDSSSVSIGSAAEGDEWRIDVPMRSFQGGYYPHLIALYRHLGVRFRQKDFSYCFSRFDREEGVAQTTMIYNGASGREGLSRPGWMQDIHLHRKAHRWLTRILGLVLFWVSTLQLLVCYVRLILFAVPRLRPQRTVMLTFEEWVGETTPSSVLARFLGLDGVWRAFARDVLVPLFSAVCTAPEDVIYAHPVEDFLDYIWLTFGTHHYVVEKGVRDVVARLTTDVKNIHLSSQIVGVYVDPANPQLASIECVSGDCSTTYHGFHHIIFATQATRVGPMLSTYAASLGADPIARHTIMAQITTLEAFHYVRSVVINHTDASVVLPRRFAGSA